MAKLPLLILALCALCGCGTTEDNPPSPVEPTETPAPLESSVTNENGEHQEFYPDGKLKLKGQMKDGQRHGLWTSYGKNGKVKSRSQYTGGVLQGPTVVYHETGEVFYSGAYDNGKPSGVWRFYNLKGEEEKTVDYDNPS